MSMAPPPQKGNENLRPSEKRTSEHAGGKARWARSMQTQYGVQDLWRVTTL